MLFAPGLTQDFEIPEEMQECTVFYNFVSELIQKRGLLNGTRGNELFKKPVIKDHKLIFASPHGFYDPIVKHFDAASMEEVAEETEALLFLLLSPWLLWASLLQHCSLVRSQVACCDESVTAFAWPISSTKCL